MYNIYITIARGNGCFVRVFEKRASPKPSPKGTGCVRANTPVRPYVCAVGRDTACRVRVALLRL